MELTKEEKLKEISEVQKKTLYTFKTNIKTILRKNEQIKVTIKQVKSMDIDNASKAEIIAKSIQNIVTSYIKDRLLMSDEHIKRSDFLIKEIALDLANKYLRGSK